MRIIGGKHRGTKLYTLEGLNTRPTLDRVKESLFSILQFDLPEAMILDLFAGSGALGLEAISRGASKAILCDQSKDAIHIIEQNVEKLKAKSKVQIFQKSYLSALEILKTQNEKFDIVFLDPPYDTDFAEIASQKIAEYDLLKENASVIIETDQTEKVVLNIEKSNVFGIVDQRKYGRVTLLFLKRK